jgi:uncharacterized protein YdiU (UPF0061 family)
MLCRQWAPQAAPRPQCLMFNLTLAEQLGLDIDLLFGEKGLAIFSGQALPAGALPVAQAYAGHQFGGFSPQLGDGRALLLGELAVPQGQRMDIALKGSGRTPFARGGDGKAAVGPMLREYLISEAMHALGIPTTRTLAVVTTGETIRRDRTLPGAIMCRIAASHLRVGTFEFVASHHATDTLEALVRFALQRHYPHALSADNPALALLHAVVDAQAELIARWMGVGFIHGVMNTDNMTISGETIDYGPCAFMEAHDPQAVFSSIDHRGRYAYGNQPNIAQWNLARFAETLLPLLHSDIDQAVALATDAIQAFRTIHAQYWLQELRAKFGLTDCVRESDDLELAHDYLRLLHAHRVDHTLGFRLLSHALRRSVSELNVLFGEGAPQLDNWLQHWKHRLSLEAKPFEEIANSMDLKNPWVIPRNHRVEEALRLASESGDLQVFREVLAAVTHPYDKPKFKADAEAALQSFTAQFQTFCGT